MRKNRFVALVLVLTLVVSLFAGCGAEEQVPGGTVTPNNTEAPTEAAKTEGDLGQLEGGTYTNKYLGLSITLDDTWTFAGADQLQELPEDAKELFSNSELADDMEKYSYIMDMQAENASQFYTMNIIYQKLDLAARLSYATMTEKTFMDAMLEQKDTLISSYTSAGINVSKIEAVEVEFLGQNRTVLKTTADVQGVPYYILQVFYHQLGAYSVTLTVGSYVEDNTQKILDMFQSI